MTNCHRYWGRNYFNESKITRLYYGEGNGTPLQYSCLENPMDGGAWKAAVHGLDAMRVGHDGAASLSFTFHFHALEREMATHSSVLAWKIPGTGEPGGLPSMGSHRVGHDWSDLAAAAADYISFILFLWKILCCVEWVMSGEQSFRVDISKPILTNCSTEAWPLCCINKTMESGTTQGRVLVVW